MKVYVVEMGCYDDKLIEDVYSSFEKVTEKYPDEVWTKWGDENIWDNDKAYEDHLTVKEFEVK